MICLCNAEGISGISCAVEILRHGGDALDALEEALRLVELDQNIDSVGVHGNPNLIGNTELDAGIMDGNTLKSGAISGLRGYLHPISVARRVLTDLPHEFLAGHGAELFAQQIKAEPETHSPVANPNWLRMTENYIASSNKKLEHSLIDACNNILNNIKGHDTVVYIGKDTNNKLVAATSTSGLAYKFPGRVGDSPVVGAGFYADSEYGAAVCTHTGEMALRTSAARSVVLYIKSGMSIKCAVNETIKDIKRLQGGLLDKICIYAVNKNEEHHVAMLHGKHEYFLWNGDTISRLTSDEVY